MWTGLPNWCHSIALITQHYPINTIPVPSLVAQYYPQLSLSKLRKLFEGMRQVIVTAIFMPSSLLHYHKANLNKAYLIFAVKS